MSNKVVILVNNQLFTTNEYAGLIVGAEPTGLMAANQLLRFSIDFILIDAKSGCLFV